MSEVTIVDDVNDLMHCYTKAEEAIRRVFNKHYAEGDIVVDYTGGTKNMSVALALAAVTRGVSFSYVGGNDRTKDGLGVVKNGHEQIYHNVNPWDVLAIEEKRKLALLTQKYQYRAAIDLIEYIIKKNITYRTFFKKCTHILNGYYRWDSFDHLQALDAFKKGKIDELMECPDTTIASFARASMKLQPFLEKLVASKGKPSKIFMLDILANAERRKREGKIDDAMVRLYRLVEMIAQERLMSGYQIDVGNVREAQIPEAIRSEFVHKYYNDGSIRIPQLAAFHLLDALGDPVGRLYKEQKAQIMKIGSARNFSWLTHGFHCIKENTYTDLYKFIISLGVVSLNDAPAFPVMTVS